jgi:hypothetical protein
MATRCGSSQPASDEKVVRDLNWVSSRMPDDIPAFNDAIVNLLTDVHPARETRMNPCESREVRASSRNGICS